MVASGTGDLETPTGSRTIGLGSKLGHFELIEPVGGGGMGRVFKARDTRLSRIVALKVLSRQQAADSETLLRFRNEARSAARLNHENIAQVYYAGEDDGFPFIASEFVEGHNIRDLVQQGGPISLAEAISYTLQIAEALQHTAASNVVHRDIKPSNMLITPQGRAKLIDLGLARLRVPESSAADLTASGVTLGTFDYISPEQARDPRNADVRSDIYSLGCTLFFMLAGRPPFPEGTVLQKLLQHQGDEPPDVRAFRPQLPDEASRLVRKMMSKDPRRRYQDPAKLLVALHALAEQIGLRPTGHAHTAWIVPARRGVSLLERHMPWAAPIAVLVGMVLLLHMLWSSPSADEPQAPGQTGVAEDYLRSLPDPDESPPSSGSDGREVAVSTDRPIDDQSPGGSVVPEDRPDETAPSPSEVSPAPMPVDGTDSATEAVDQIPLSVDEPNPLEAITSIGAELAGLGPEDVGGRLSAARRSSASLSMVARLDPNETRLRGDTAVGSRSSVFRLPAESTLKHSRVLVVDPAGQDGSCFASLSAAVEAAGDGDVIELHFDGPLEARPLSFGDVELTVRAAEGYRPIVLFEPSEVDPIKYPRRMFTLTGSRLTLVDLGVELNVPKEVPAENWAMLEIACGDRLVLDRCSLTIRNASGNSAAGPASYHPEVAFFRLTASPGSDAFLGAGSVDGGRQATVELNGCTVRGEAVFLKTADAQPVELKWRNGLLATTEWLLDASGGERPSPADERIGIDLEHVTALVLAGLCKLDRDEFAPYQLPAKIRCADCILMTSQTNPGSLIEQAGVLDLDQARSEVHFVDEGNFFQGFVTFWNVDYLEYGVTPVMMTFGQWESHWQSGSGGRSLLDRVQWRQLPGTSRPVHSHTPVDYLLSDAAGYNPAIGSAGDGSDAGLILDGLPSQLSGSPPTPGPMDERSED